MFANFIFNSTFIVIFYVSILYFNLSALTYSLFYIHILIMSTVSDYSMILLYIDLTHGLILLYRLQIKH